MNKCQHCNIVVYDNIDACPMCHRVLDEMEEQDILAITGRFGEGAPYPDIRKRTRSLHFVMRLILFLFIIAEITLIVINYYVSPHIWWSGISGIAMSYTYLSMVYWIKHDAGYSRKIGSQLILTMLLLFGIDYFTGMIGWSLQWAIPGIILFGDAIVFFLMMLNRHHWYSYTVLLLVLAIGAGLIIGLYFIGKITNVILPTISVIVTGVYVLATIVFGDRELKRELKRRFHV